MKELKKKEKKRENDIKIDLRRFNKEQRKEIRVGLLDGLDVSWYAKPEFNWRQMDEIRLGLIKGLDVSWYARSEFDALQMMEIRDGLLEGLDVSMICKA